jgi:hypothetical protein
MPVVVSAALTAERPGGLSACRWPYCRYGNHLGGRVEHRDLGAVRLILEHPEGRLLSRAVTVSGWS